MTAVVCGVPAYSDPAHADLPHVVKFSGGRSSAAMTLSMARSGALKPSRRDVVLVANTTAEHPATYEFAAQVCNELESEHGVPCLWYEFCTVEDAARGRWTRVPSCRLVRRVKASSGDDPARPGYRDDGTAFEELVSLKGMVPNRRLRFCTQWLKVLPGLELISYWLGGGPGLPHAGHHHGDRLARCSSDARAFLNNCPVSRPAQKWADFAPVAPAGDGPTPAVDIAGRSGPAVQFVTCLGLRADEQKRVQKAHMQALLYGGAGSPSCRHDSHPAGEVIATPLADAGADKTSVKEFWSRQRYDLRLDDGRGNCVYCFMKGEPAIRLLAASEAKTAAGPAGIQWWAGIESRYAGESISGPEGRFKFLSLRAPSYTDIAADPDSAVRGRASAVLPCSCTD